MISVEVGYLRRLVGRHSWFFETGELNNFFQPALCKMPDSPDTFSYFVNHFCQFIILRFVQLMKFHEAGTFDAPVITSCLIVKDMLVSEQLIKCGSNCLAIFVGNSNIYFHTNSFVQKYDHLSKLALLIVIRGVYRVRGALPFYDGPCHFQNIC